MLKHEKDCYYKDVEIRFCDCDKHKQARIESILRIMADIAGVAYAAKGYSHAWLWERHSVFLVTRASIRIHRMPAADETITVETWERTIKGAQYYRDFAFYDQQGERIVEGETAWVVVDPYTRTIQRPDEFPGTFTPLPEKRPDVLPTARLKPKGDLERVGERTIVYSDIDGNNHTYNAVYAGISCDFLPADLLDHPIRDFRINFKQEALLGETLEIRRRIDGHEAIVAGYLGDAMSFEAEFHFAEECLG